MQQKLNNRGFSIVAIFFVILMTAVLGMGGYYVWHKNKYGNASIFTMHTSKPQATSSTNSGSLRTDSTNPSVATTYLEIKEWGIRLPLSDSIKDAYYVVPGGISLNVDSKPSGIIFGLKSLDASCGVVSADPRGYDNNLGGIVRAQPAETDPVSGKTHVEQEPNGVTIGDYYYGFVNSALKQRTSCIATAKIQTLDAAFSDAVRHANQSPVSH